MKPFKLKVPVTKVDIATRFSRRYDPWGCPLYVALRRALRKANVTAPQTYAGFDTAAFGSMNNWWQAVIPNAQARPYREMLGDRGTAKSKPFTLNLTFKLVK